MKKGERVRWYVFGSTNFEMHAPHWHGNVVVANHMRTDVVGLLPMGMLVADMTPDAAGTWLFHCHTGPHLLAGMVGKYVVQDAAAAAPTATGGLN
jgi:hephaestin